MTRLPDLHALFEDPGLYPLAADIPGRRLLFVPLDRPAARAAAFHDPRRIRPDAAGGLPVDAGPLLAAAGGRPKVRRIVFHTAYCASTLLSRALDALPGTHGWREPYLLLQAAEVGDEADRSAWLDLAMGLLDRGGTLGRVVVKAHDRVLGAATDLLARDPGLRAVALHTDLEAFVLACVRSRDRRAWTAGALSRLGMEAPARDGAGAAALWLDRIGATRALLAQFGAAHRVLAVDGGRLVSGRRALLPDIARQLDLPAPADGLFDDPLWRRHAKEPSAAYDEEEHAARHRRLADRHAAALADAHRALDALLRERPALSREIQRRGGRTVFEPASGIC